MRQLRETFDKSILVNSRQLQLLMDQQQHIMNVVTRLAEDVTHLSGEIHAGDAFMAEDVTGEIHAGDAFIGIHSYKSITCMNFTRQVSNILRQASNYIHNMLLLVHQQL